MRATLHAHSNISHAVRCVSSYNQAQKPPSWHLLTETVAYFPDELLAGQEARFVSGPDLYGLDFLIRVFSICAITSR